MPLIEKTGTSSFYLNMTIKQLRDAVFGLTYGVDYRTKSGFFTYHLIIGEAINVQVNILTDSSKAVIDRIDFYGNYKGTYNGVGIGSTVEDLLKVRKDVFFDEEYIMVGEGYPYDFIIKIDNDDASIYSLEEVRHNKIIQITVEDQRLLKQ